MQRLTIRLRPVCGRMSAPPSKPCSKIEEDQETVRGTVFPTRLAEFLGRLRYGRSADKVRGYRHGHRERQLTGTFGSETVRLPRARIENESGQISE